MIRNFLKAIAIILIVLPEPFTTPVGIALLSATAASPKHKRLDSFKNMDELVERSFKIVEPGQFGRHLENEKAMVFHELKRKAPSQGVAVLDAPASPKRIQRKTSKDLQPCFIETSSKLPRNNVRMDENLLANCSANKWFDNRRVPEKILHHTLKTSFPQY